MDQNTSPTLHTCAISGEASAGKHYILKSTEGEELVCPEALFHNGADRRLVVALVDLQMRIAHLEEHLGIHPEAPDVPEDQEGDDVHQDDDKPQATKGAAKKAPAKKAPAARKAGA